MRTGVHVSIAGGIVEAPARASRLGCGSFQIFTHSSRTWDFPEFSDENIGDFSRRKDHCLEGAPFLVHASYLINVATARPDLILKSSITLRLEWELANRLGAAGLVLHPGSTGGSPVPEAIDRAAEMIASVVEQDIPGPTRLLIENTAGAGHTLGRSPEEIGRIVELVGHEDRIGLCLDSCHLLASGYDIRDEDGYRDTLNRFLSVMPRGVADAFHVNDAFSGLGSARDRHTHIGIGHIGPWFFWRLLHDERFADIPLVLETPKKDEFLEDELNLSMIHYLQSQNDPPDKEDPVLTGILTSLYEVAPR